MSQPQKPPVHFTPTERRILALLNDGASHTRREIHACLNDDLAQLSAINRHINSLREKIPEGQEIICCLSNKRISYRLLRQV